MSDTDLLYATDAYLRTFDAHVEELTPDGGVILDRTALYPTGGGQPHDLGTLTWQGGSGTTTTGGTTFRQALQQATAGTSITYDVILIGTD